MGLARPTVRWRHIVACLPPGGWFVCLFFALLALPAILQSVSSGPVDLGAENRRPAPPPSWPTTIAEIPLLPGIVDAYLSDRFGLRGPLVRLDTYLRWRILGDLSSPRLIAGRNGRVFLAAYDGEARDSDTLITMVCGASVSEDVIARAAASIRHAIQIARDAGLDPTFLLVPTPVRLHPEDLPPTLATKCAGHTPLGDAIAARVTDLPVLFPAAEMKRLGGIPRHRFHWAGAVPLHIAEEVAETRWGLRRSFSLPVERKTRGSDINPLSPGLDLSDSVDEVQLRAAGVWECWSDGCNGAGPPAGALQSLTGYARPGKGRLLIVADSFGDEISPDFLQEFAEVWVVHTNDSRAMSPDAKAALSAWVRQHFRGEHVLLIVNELGVIGAIDQLVADALGADR